MPRIVGYSDDGGERVAVVGEKELRLQEHVQDESGEWLWDDVVPTTQHQRINVLTQMVECLYNQIKAMEEANEKH